MAHDFMRNSLPHRPASSIRTEALPCHLGSESPHPLKDTCKAKCAMIRTVYDIFGTQSHLVYAHLVVAVVTSEESKLKEEFGD